MLKLDDIIGQETAKKSLAAALPPGRHAGAYLFLGPEGMGKWTTALAWTRTLFCEAQRGDACGVCVPCRKIEHGAFPDLHFLKPEIRDKKVKKEIDIDHIRELIARLAYKPYEAAMKVAVIDGAHQMNRQAANAFLKTLEEPPGDTVLILLATNLNALLPTIVSRCQTVRFRPVPYGDMIAFLTSRHGMNEQQAATAAAMSRGAPGLAAAGVADDSLTLRGEALEMLENARSATAGDIFKIAKALDKAADRQKVDRLLTTLQQLVRDALVMKLTGKYDTLIHKDIGPAIEQAASRFTARKLLLTQNSITEMIAARRWNINPLLATSLLLMELKE